MACRCCPVGPPSCSGPASFWFAGCGATLAACCTAYFLMYAHRRRAVRGSCGGGRPLDDAQVRTMGGGSVMDWAR